jgi:CubicO group peptidase (beta-lactamase class C family)
MNRIWILFILLTTTFQAVGQDRFKNLDACLQELENEDSFSGAVVIAKNGETLFSKTIGFADRENRVKINSDSQFDLSSTSKLFTGTSVLKLVQEGKIKTDDKIGKYFPELEYGGKVTIHHLKGRMKKEFMRKSM